MDGQELGELVRSLRRLGAEPTGIEVKSAAGGLPKSAIETLCAFGNTDGGLLLLGLDEEDGFAPVRLPQPGKLRDDLLAAAADQLQPPLRPAAELVELDEHVIVAVTVDPVNWDQRPCYVAARGIAAGSFVRVGDADRRMTQAEIGLAVANRGQPRYDAEPIRDASLQDLSRPALLRTLERLQRTTGAFDIDEPTALRRLRVLVEDDSGALVPSLAGLLTFGLYPQEFLPQLTLTVVVYGPDRGADGSARFLDNPVLRGPIPQLVLDAERALLRNMSVRSTVTGVGRHDEPDYPVEAVREAIVNALMHRDYSHVTRGTQVQVELHPDRLLVRSPGGLFGPVGVHDLGAEGVSSSRNAYLAQLLTDAFVPGSDRTIAENRASGIPQMIEALRRRGLAPPRFSNRPSGFEVELRGYAGAPPVSQTPPRARVSPAVAADLVAAALRARGTSGSTELAADTGLSRPTVLKYLRQLVAGGSATADPESRGPRRAYRWTGG
ncbi:MAG: ATP-binding protein [Pseudonocardiaceae bacterium]